MGHGSDTSLEAFPAAENEGAKSLHLPDASKRLAVAGSRLEFKIEVGH
jgi:hypothetical protein